MFVILARFWRPILFDLEIIEIVAKKFFNLGVGHDFIIRPSVAQ